jgi:hypothetical protein
MFLVAIHLGGASHPLCQNALIIVIVVKKKQEMRILLDICRCDNGVENKGVDENGVRKMLNYVKCQVSALYVKGKDRWEFNLILKWG